MLVMLSTTLRYWFPLVSFVYVISKSYMQGHVILSHDSCNPKKKRGPSNGEGSDLTYNCFCSLQRFAAVIMRIREPRTTALVFSSGKMVCTGAKRWEHEKSFTRIQDKKVLTALFSLILQWGIFQTGCKEICSHYSKTWLSCKQIWGEIPSSLLIIMMSCYVHAFRLVSWTSRFKTWLGAVMWSSPLGWKALL